MIALTAPSSAEDDAYLTKICEEPAWTGYLGLWASCYHAYRVHGGNPWSIASSKFSEALGGIQQKLYENRKSVARFKKLRGRQVASCPMCGSSVTGALDHFLPKETFPEFSVMAANLVPACTSCNSSVKGRTYKGESPDEWLKVVRERARDLFDGQLDFALSHPIDDPDLRVSDEGEDFTLLYGMEYGQPPTEQEIEQAWAEIEQALANLYKMSVVRDALKSADYVISQRALQFELMDGVTVLAYPDAVVFSSARAPLIVDWKVHAFGQSDARLQLAIYAIALSRAKRHSDFPSDRNTAFAATWRSATAAVIEGNHPQRLATDAKTIAARGLVSPTASAEGENLQKNLLPGTLTGALPTGRERLKTAPNILLVTDIKFAGVRHR